MASTAPRDVESPVASKHLPKAATVSTARPKPETAAWFWHGARFLGSLQFAIITGTVFTVAMIIGTCLESWYSDKIAQELVYYSWWFITLLGLLGCSILFAAVKKWPWKKHQTGFLITHMGLLTILGGGVLNAGRGVDAVMSLVDSPYAQEEGDGPRRSNQASLPNDTMLVVRRQVVEDGQQKPRETTIKIKPGPLAWGTNLHGGDDTSGLIRVMDFLANPFPRAFARQIDQDLELEVLAHLPHTNIEPVEAAGAMEFGYPALKVELNTRDFGHQQAQWIALNDGADKGPVIFGRYGRRPMNAEFLARAEPVFVDEFLKPPTERGKLGQLVFALGGHKHRIDVAAHLGKTVPLGDSGWKVTLVKYLPGGKSEDQNSRPFLPSVECQVISPDGQVTRKYRVTGRLTMYSAALMATEEPTYDTPEGLPAAWYHPPDLRYGNDGTSDVAHKYLLQFLQTTDNKLYYRSLVERNGVVVVEDGGAAPPAGVEQRIWETQAGNFIITEHLPFAKKCIQRVVPVAMRPGLLSPANPSALLCRLTLTQRDSKNQPHTFTKELWVPQSFGSSAVTFDFSGTLDGQPFEKSITLSYVFGSIDLGFDLELCRAESLQDPGTDQAATFTSYVKVYEHDRKIDPVTKKERVVARLAGDHMITMNEPLDFHGYKVYQSQFRHLDLEPGTGRPMHLSGFTIGYDPGLWFKYLGTAMIGLGIATMYYMKAYFFKPKASRQSAAA